MKTTSLILTTLMSLVLSLTASAQSTSPKFQPRIVEITPAQASIGQTITVRLESAVFADITLKATARDAVRRGFTPDSASATPRILFTNSSGRQELDGVNVIYLGSHRYSVEVPDGARSGKLRYKSTNSDTLSTVNFTLVNSGYFFINRSQFSITSISVDRVERLGNSLLPPVAPASPIAAGKIVGTTPGNHGLQVTLGAADSGDVITYYLPATAATTPHKSMVIEKMLAGEFLTASRNARELGTKLTASWKDLVFPENGQSFVRGFDFTYDLVTKTTTWKHWTTSQSNVDAAGTMSEPASWELNPTRVILSLIKSDGTLFGAISVDFLTKTLFPRDGNSYELE